MNLVASEYVACQEARHGVLVLSEFTGAATFMKHGSLLFNPSNADGLSNALYEAVTMEKKDKEKMYEELRSFVTTNTRLVFPLFISPSFHAPVFPTSSSPTRSPSGLVTSKTNNHFLQYEMDRDVP
jgi:trehalose 6-phosphate synthase